LKGGYMAVPFTISGAPCGEGKADVIETNPVTVIKSLAKEGIFLKIV